MYWDLNNENVYLFLEDMIRQKKDAYSSRVLNLIYQATVKMTTTSLRILSEYTTYTST